MNYEDSSYSYWTDLRLKSFSLALEFTWEYLFISFLLNYYRLSCYTLLKKIFFLLNMGAHFEF